MGGLEGGIVLWAGGGVCELQQHREVTLVSLSGSLAQAVVWCLCTVVEAVYQRLVRRVAEEIGSTTAQEDETSQLRA